MWRFAGRKTIKRDALRICIKRCPGEGCPAELKISGCVKSSDMDSLKHAIKRFEDCRCMKLYLNIGNVTYLSPSAIAELAELRNRIEERGDLFDVVDISVDVEKAVKEIGFRTSFRSAYYA